MVAPLGAVSLGDFSIWGNDILSLRSTFAVSEWGWAAGDNGGVFTEGSRGGQGIPGCPASLLAYLQSHCALVRPS